MEYIECSKTGVQIPTITEFESNQLPSTPTDPNYTLELLKQLTEELTIHNFILTALPITQCLPWKDVELRELDVDPSIELALYSYPSTQPPAAPPVYPMRAV